MDSASANPHLNVFEPYRELGRTHEDQLTRAAMIVLRLVPLARETLLRAIGERSQSELPDCAVDMQATYIVDASEESAAGGEVQRERLVSVFLTPDTEPQEPAREVTDTSRGQRFDGVLRFDPELVVLVESKVCTRWARRNGHRVAELNLGSARFAQRRTCVLRWHDLLESWWRLVELGLLSPAERALVQDLLTYAHHDFAHLLPFGSLRRVGADPVRRKWRLRSLLREATGLQPERIGLAHVRLDTALGTASLQRAALDLDSHELVLHMWPGELKRQAEYLYGDAYAARLAELPLETDAAWRVQPQPQLGFRNAPARTRVYLSCRLDAVTYAARWQGEDWAQVGAHQPDTILPELWPWLLKRRYASKRDLPRVEAFLRTLGRRHAHLRPSMHIARVWPFAQATALDDDGLLATQIRDAINHILTILQEPRLPAPVPAAQVYSIASKLATSNGGAGPSASAAAPTGALESDDAAVRNRAARRTLPLDRALAPQRGASPRRRAAAGAPAHRP
ncbi:MAG TPA: hypothetical protein VK756_02460 [Solirubrobacteraceae bacterium]|jgi:hypothetical protein|nr:hypothetical protein [Solirubrobacteraceae bacterium]